MAAEYIALRGSCAAFSRPSCSKFQMHLSFLVSDAHQHITPSNHQRFCNLHKKGLAWHLGLGENFSLHTYLAICTAKCNETDSWAISYKLKWIEYPRVTSHMSLFFSSLGSSFESRNETERRKKEGGPFPRTETGNRRPPLSSLPVPLSPNG